MTLASICQGALREIGEFEVPDTFVGSANRTATQMLNLAQREGRVLSRRFDWQALTIRKTFTTTVAEIQTGAIPADFRHFKNLTWWDDTNQWKLRGPATANQWQILKSGISAAAAQKWVRRRGNDLLLWPAPTVTTDTISYEYVSKYWVDTDADDAGDSASWVADDDTALLDEELMQMGLVWRFLKSKGLPYEEEYNEYEIIVRSAMSHDKGHSDLYLASRVSDSFLIDHDNIPDTNYGS